ncbi:MAG: hypothetical protein HRU70_00660 [Phycisphaeraceae bacterium]|nr:MAG: hypothetical protein HRU70_00660 [Phycisphaeraceae bacterium]
MMWSPRSVRIGAWLLGLAVMTLALGGCGSGPKAYGVSIELDPDSMKNRSTGMFPAVRADVMPAYDAAGRQRLEAVSVTDHFNRPEADRQRTDRARTLSLGQTGRATLTADDPVRASWGKPRFVVVMVDIPNYESRGGETRRAVLSMNPSRWGEDPVRLRVDRSGVTVVSPAKATGGEPDGY